MKNVALVLLSFLFICGCGSGSGSGSWFGSGNGSGNGSGTSVELSSIQVTAGGQQSIAKGTSQKFSATGIYSDNSKKDLTALVTWSCQTAGIVTVSTNGLGKGIAAGTTKVIATYSGKSGNMDFTVTDAVLQSIEVASTNPSIPRGLKQQLTAIGIFSDNSIQDLTNDVIWSSSDAATVKVDSTGLATAAAGPAGPVTITATEKVSGVIFGTTDIMVTAATLTEIDVDPPAPSIVKGTSQQFTATGIYSDDSTADLTSQVTWRSDAAGIATISNSAGSEGLAASVATGTANISATLAGSGVLPGSSVLTVTAATLVSIDVSPDSTIVPKGLPVQYQALGNYSDGTTGVDITAQVTWNSSNTEVATISNVVADGTIGTAATLAPGTATITATLAGVQDTADLTVTSATLQSIELTPASPFMALGTSLQFTATGNYSDGTTQDLTRVATWRSSNRAVATISNSQSSRGMARSVSQGTTEITATWGTMSNAVPVTLTVAAATLNSITVTPASATLYLGGRLQYTAAASYTTTVGAVDFTQDLTTQATWRSSDRSIASISNSTGSKGLASSVRSGGPVTISAGYGGKSGSAQLTISSSQLRIITVTPNPATVANGKSVQLKATGTFADGHEEDITTSVHWATSNRHVASISSYWWWHNNTGRGLVRGVSPGTTTITATRYGISGNTTVTVTP